jgi:hypothetical protein
VGAYRPVDDALRIAFTELGSLDSQGLWLDGLGRVRTAVEGGKDSSERDGGSDYAVVASMEKKYLSKKKQ